LVFPILSNRILERKNVKAKHKLLRKAPIILIICILLFLAIRPQWLSNAEKLFRGKVSLEQTFHFTNGPRGFGGKGDWFIVYQVKGLENLAPHAINKALKRRPIWSNTKPSGWRRFKWKNISLANQQESEAIKTLLIYLSPWEKDSKDMVKNKKLFVSALKAPSTKISGLYRNHELIIYAYSPSKNMLFYYACIN
jgi:hypothetical protein